MVDECLGCHPRSLAGFTFTRARRGARRGQRADVSAVGGEQRHAAAVRPGGVNASDQVRAPVGERFDHEAVQEDRQL